MLRDAVGSAEYAELTGDDAGRVMVLDQGGARWATLQDAGRRVFFHDTTWPVLESLADAEERWYLQGLDAKWCRGYCHACHARFGVRLSAGQVAQFKCRACGAMVGVRR